MYFNVELKVRNSFQRCLRRLLHLGEDHGGDLLGVEPLGDVLIRDLDQRLVVRALVREDPERPELDVRLDQGIVEPAFVVIIMI